MKYRLIITTNNLNITINKQTTHLVKAITPKKLISLVRLSADSQMVFLKTILLGQDNTK